MAVADSSYVEMEQPGVPTAGTPTLEPLGVGITAQHQETGSYYSGESAGSGDKGASSTTLTVSLAGAKNKLLDGMCFMCFHSMRRRHLRWLRGPLLVFDMIQMLSFILDDRFFYRNEESAKILKALRYLRNPTASIPPAYAGACIAVVASVAIALLLLAFLHSFFVRNGMFGNFFDSNFSGIYLLSGVNKLHSFFRCFLVIVPSVILPFAYAALCPFQDVPSASAAQLIIGGTCGLYLCVFYVTISLLFVPMCFLFSDNLDAKISDIPTRLLLYLTQEVWLVSHSLSHA